MFRDLSSKKYSNNYESGVVLVELEYLESGTKGWIFVP